MSRGIKAIEKNKKSVLSEEKIQEIHDYILNNQYMGKEKRIEHKEKIQEMKKQKEDLENQNVCPYCKTSLILRKGKYGDFYGCKNYPKCKYTKK